MRASSSASGSRNRMASPTSMSLSATGLVTTRSPGLKAGSILPVGTTSKCQPQKEAVRINKNIKITVPNISQPNSFTNLIVRFSLPYLFSNSSQYYLSATVTVTLTLLWISSISSTSSSSIITSLSWLMKLSRTSQP